jgi:hypothetical protein
MNEPMKHLTEDELTLFHYGESEERSAAARHLLSCSQCRADYDELLLLLETVDSLPVPQRGPGYEAQVWQRVQPRLDGRRGLLRRRMTLPQRWAVAASVILVLGAGFLAGRLWTPAPALTAAGPISEQGRERILLVAVGEHLDRTQMMLVEIVNEEELDLPAAQERAEMLLASNRLYRQSLPASADPVLNAVLEDLERVLLDIAHGSSEPEGALDQVRARIEKRGLLFKVRIIGSQVRQQEKQIRAETSANRT